MKLNKCNGYQVGGPNATWLAENGTGRQCQMAGRRPMAGNIHTGSEGQKKTFNYHDLTKKFLYT